MRKLSTPAVSDGRTSGRLWEYPTGHPPPARCSNKSATGLCVPLNTHLYFCPSFCNSMLSQLCHSTVPGSAPADSLALPALPWSCSLMCRSTALTLCSCFIGKTRRYWSSVIPLRMFSNRLDTGIRPRSKHHAPLILFGFRQTPGQPSHRTPPGPSSLCSILSLFRVRCFVFLSLRSRSALVPSLNSFPASYTAISSTLLLPSRWPARFPPVSCRSATITIVALCRRRWRPSTARLLAVRRSFLFGRSRPLSQGPFFAPAETVGLGVGRRPCRPPAGNGGLEPRVRSQAVLSV